mmetsp:Transcript_32250/g.65867  ORF Transcript_32250/g.65867 Transcript_32250/m.65867 type:complete len:258 (-) Transcript_32250:556-1329(-)
MAPFLLVEGLEVVLGVRRQVVGHGLLGRIPLKAVVGGPTHGGDQLHAVLVLAGGVEPDFAIVITGDVQVVVTVLWRNNVGADTGPKVVRTVGGGVEGFKECGIIRRQAKVPFARLEVLDCFATNVEPSLHDGAMGEVDSGGSCGGGRVIPARTIHLHLSKVDLVIGIWLAQPYSRTKDASKVEGVGLLISDMGNNLPGFDASIGVQHFHTDIFDFVLSPVHAVIDEDLIHWTGAVREVHHPPGVPLPAGVGNRPVVP